jgi:hypothetical protein
MLNFDTDLDVARAQGARTVQVTATVPSVRETLTVTRLSPAPATRETRTTDVGKSPEEWSWEDLRNYVVRQIETFFGEFPKDPARLRGIFSSFHARHGRMAGPIAVAAFETFGGRWKGAPISVTRFCLKSDPWFADPIKQRLSVTT